MGGGAFILLKSGGAGPESAKQVENRLANLLKILQITRLLQPKRSPKPERTCIGCIVGISGDMANCPGIARFVT
jgi:hypothetical protein